jgi:hypothetical protein
LYWKLLVKLTINNVVFSNVLILKLIFVIYNKSIIHRRITMPNCFYTNHPCYCPQCKGKEKWRIHCCNCPGGSQLNQCPRCGSLEPSCGPCFSLKDIPLKQAKVHGWAHTRVADVIDHDDFTMKPSK